MHDPAKIDKPLIRVIDDDDAMRNSWAFLIEGEGWDVKTYADAITFLSSTTSAPAVSSSTSACRTCPALSFSSS